jgi:hypothetical protein
MNPTLGVSSQNIDFSCLDKYAGFFRGEAPINLPHIGQAAIDAHKSWRQRNYDEFRRSLEAQFVNVDLETANQRYRELVRRHDSVERSRMGRVISSDSKCVGKEMECKRNLLFDALLRREPYVGDFMQDILTLTFVNGMTSEFAWTSVIDNEIVRDYLKCVMSIIRQLRPEITNVGLDEPLSTEMSKNGGKYKKHIKTKRRNKKHIRTKRRNKRKTNKNRK